MAGTGTGILLERLDHLVLTVRDIEATCAFYEKVLGMTRRTFGEGRVALHYGPHKINLHPHPTPIDLVAKHPLPGTADLCFVAATPLAEVVAHLEACKVPVEVGPIATTGARGPMTSVYFRDPDDNLIEVSNYGAG
jgi:catechol 2,3-dioxygenase-like lactoylglutathione lyase family enzyme